MIFDDDSSATITFVKGHRADDQPHHHRRVEISPRIVLIALGIIFVVTSGIAINVIA